MTLFSGFSWWQPCLLKLLHSTFKTTIIDLFVSWVEDLEGVVLEAVRCIQVVPLNNGTNQCSSETLKKDLSKPLMTTSVFGIYKEWYWIKIKCSMNKMLILYVNSCSARLLFCIHQLGFLKASRWHEPRLLSGFHTQNRPSKDPKGIHSKTEEVQILHITKTLITKI